ncbi:IclR family transcriptional regulator [Vibrio taketomensis]|uniref:IclR family transcriptional regulator n=1 Tax=Vibrio taketomensis TaxID=2572923 RepID=UPI0013899D0B|nr:IclR family transcriptional regulator C-terminal domain-containing protein [Vibrio taketomensis]
MSKETKRIQSVERSFSILEALSLSEQSLSLQNISEIVALNKTTVHGLLATMCALGYVNRTKQGYSLGLRIRELFRPLEQKDEAIRRHFNGLLNQMAQLTNNTAYLAVKGGEQEYLYIDAIERQNPLTIRSPRGRREGLATSAIGKVFLAFDKELLRQFRLQTSLPPELEKELSQVLTNGYSLDLEQAEPNLNCLAFPLYMAGELVAVAGISGAATELTHQRLIHFAEVFLKMPNTNS